jgi:hypothetical protein
VIKEWNLKIKMYLKIPVILKLFNPFRREISVLLQSLEEMKTIMHQKLSLVFHKMPLNQGRAPLCKCLTLQVETISRLLHKGEVTLILQEMRFLYLQKEI